MFVKKEGKIFGRLSQVSNFFIGLNSAPGWDGNFLRKTSNSGCFCPSKEKADGKWGDLGANEGKRWEWGGGERATEAEGLGGQDDTRKGGRLENQKEEGGGGRMKKQIIREGARKKIHRALPGKKNRKPRKLWGKSVQRKAEEKISKSGVPPPTTKPPVLERGDTHSCASG